MPLHDVLTVQLISLSKPVGPNISVIIMAFLRAIRYIFLSFIAIKPKKDVATIPNAVGKGKSKSIPKKVLFVILSYVTFTTILKA